VTRAPSDLVIAVLDGAGLAAASIAIAAGADVHRWGPVAGLLAVGLAAELFVGAGRALLRRRAKRQATLPIPRGLVLRKPRWISATEHLGLVSVAATLGAVPAALGYPSTGVGVLTVLVGFPLAVVGAAGTYDTTTLAFEEEGLRIGTRGAALFVPWRAITGVEREGREGHRLVCVHLAGAADIIQSVVPATPRARMRATIIVGPETGNVGKMTLLPWTAGLEGTVLARALLAFRPAATLN
jgi:hypothetical protein